MTKILWVALILVGVVSVVTVNFMIPDDLIALFLDFIHQDDKQPEIEPETEIETVLLPTTIQTFLNSVLPSTSNCCHIN